MVADIAMPANSQGEENLKSSSRTSSYFVHADEIKIKYIKT